MLREAHAIRFVSKAAGEPGCACRRGSPGPPLQASADAPAESDSAREILELLELELGAMIRQLKQAANSVAGGAEAAATTLSASASAPTP